MLFLRVENKVRHIPDVDFLVTVGESTSRGNTESIGQFGTGFVYALAVFAREFGALFELCKVCLGKKVFTPYIDSVLCKDSTGITKQINKIGLKQQNGGKYDLNIATGFGSVDWTSLTMGVREIISNAFDGAETYDGTYNSVDITEVQENQCRASDGVVRVYIPIVPEVEDYISNIDTYFLCIKKNYNPNVRVLAKHSVDGPALIYRKGVLVGKIGKKSMFNYNLPDIPLNECRVVNYNQAKEECAKAIVQHAREDQLNRFISDMLLGGNTDEEVWENTFSQWDINPRYMGNVAEERFSKSISKVLGSTVVCANDLEKEMVKSKGMHGVVPKKDSYDIFANANTVKAKDILSDTEALGHTIIPATAKVNEVLNEIWDKLAALNLTNGRDKPPVECFNSALNGGYQTLGYCNVTFDRIYIHQDISNDNGNQLYSVMLEEVGHYVTRAKDCTRDFQTFFIGLAARLMHP